MSVLDRTKVIKGLGEALTLLAEYVPGERYLGYAPGACLDAIELLKAQEPVAPIFDYDGRDVWRCGNCHRNIFHPTRTDEDENEKNYRRFCFHCGKAVEWK